MPSSRQPLRQYHLDREDSGATRAAINTPSSRSPSQRTSMNYLISASYPIYAPVPFISFGAYLEFHLCLNLLILHQSHISGHLITIHFRQISEENVLNI